MKGKLLVLFLLMSLCLNLLLMSEVAETGAAPNPSIISYWKFDEGEGVSAVDSIGYNDGVISGASWTKRGNSNALCFDGVDDYVEIADSHNLNPDQFTILAWIRLDSAHRGGIVVKGTSAKNIYILENYYGQVYIGVRNAAGLWNEIHTVKVLSLDKWYFVAGSYDGNKLSIYVDGEFENSLAHGENLNQYPSKLYIGASALFKFNGGIDEVALCNKALSNDEVRECYKDTKVGKPYPAIESMSAWWDKWRYQIESVIKWQPDAEKRIQALEKQISKK